MPRIRRDRRPFSVTIIGWLFVLAGSVGFFYHIREFRGALPDDYKVASICAIRLFAILGGIFVLRGSNWARWLVVAWFAYHVGLSAFHTISGLVIHSVLLAVIVFSLYRRQASSWFATGKEKEEAIRRASDVP